MQAKTVFGTRVIPGITVHQNGIGAFVRIGQGKDAPVILINEKQEHNPLIPLPPLNSEPRQGFAKAWVREINAEASVPTGRYEIFADQRSTGTILVLYQVMSLPCGQVGEMENRWGVKVYAQHREPFTTLAGNTVELLSVLLAIQPNGHLSLRRFGVVDGKYASRWANLKHLGASYLSSLTEESVKRLTVRTA